MFLVKPPLRREKRMDKERSISPSRRPSWRVSGLRLKTPFGATQFRSPSTSNQPVGRRAAAPGALSNST